MAPLFDNGAIKTYDSLEGTYITTLGRSKKDDVIDLLFTEYYDYASDFAKQLASEYEKQTTFTLYHDYGNCLCGMLEQ